MRALEGVKIADFSWVGAGPRATKDLADNGALVIKIESARRLDLGRRSPPFADSPKDYDGSAFFAQSNTSKKSVTLNLSDPRGVDLARQLVGWADVVVENFGPNYMERIGLGFETLRKIKPDIILASVSVAGRTGPMAGFRGYGNSAAAHSGHAALSGWPDRPPHMPPLAYGDVVAPMFATVAVLAALEYRSRTGRGQHLDISQIEPMVHVIADLFADPDAGKSGNADPVMAPHGVYRCKGDKWIAIAAETNAQWRSICTVLGLTPDTCFETAKGRIRHLQQLDQQVAQAIAARSRDDLIIELSQADVPVAAVQNGRDVFEDPELRAAGHVVPVQHPVLGTSMMPTPPMIFSQTPSAVSAAPCLGAHNDEVLSGILGLSAERLEELKTLGVVA
ncbi:CaiB/BaiF CoA transferase family protein [Roseinatronobacter alkalisoli]|uniref:CoA transferase n=1 Tax=Roseinatronobacter alkalisoli TaxID=3028235 RepID=A0ABT5TCM0_9RHOB|nr:CoA transferase [Roseinatronobacter sp. HJB301]MDD7972709.1 CoA transferase [Roseinatronobacter sp. HJB301]